MNSVELTAVLIERDALRHTPAGIPVVNCVLRHAGLAEEAGATRRIEFDLPAVAAGAVSSQVQSLTLGQAAKFTGFLARKRMNSKLLALHLTSCGPATDKQD